MYLYVDLNAVDSRLFVLGLQIFAEKPAVREAFLNCVPQKVRSFPLPVLVLVLVLYLLYCHTRSDIYTCVLAKPSHLLSTYVEITTLQHVSSSSFVFILCSFLVLSLSLSCSFVEAMLLWLQMTAEEFWNKYVRAEYLFHTKNSLAAAAEAADDEYLALFVDEDKELDQENQRKVRNIPHHLYHPFS